MKVKKMVAASSILLAIVCGTGGYIAIKDQQQATEDRKLVEKQLSNVQDIVIKEGESLPDLKEAFADASMIDQTSIQVDIQNVDSTVPGSYDVICTFNDVRGNQGEKIINCEVQPNLAQHVTGMEDITIDCGDVLPVANTEYDSYVESVVRDDSLVDIEEPGTYPITYSVLGTNGEIDNVERLVTVLDNRPEPTPAPTEKPKKAEKTAESGRKTGSSENAEADNGSGAEAPEDLTGNVDASPENDHTVATDDTSNILGYFFALCMATAGAVFALFKKYGQKD